jgi:hypothetical protein
VRWPWLVKELRVRKIRCLKRANELLEKSFLPLLTRRFTVPPARAADVHRRVPRNINLDRVLSFQESRVVQNDWTVSWRNRWFQLTEANRKLPLARARVLVSERLDGTIELLYRGRALEWVELPGRPERQERAARRGPAAGDGKKWRPAPNHPWRKRAQRGGE